MAREQKSSKKKIRTDKIDFGGVEGPPGQRRTRKIPEGDYIAKIVSVERKRGEKSNKPYYNWKFQVLESASGSTKYKGTPLYYVTSLQPDALFNLRNLIFAASDGKKNVTGKAVNFTPTDLVGKKIGIVVEDDEYENKIRSRVVDVQPPSAIVADDDEDEEEEDDEDEDDEDEDDEEDEDEDDEDDDELEDADLD